MTPEIFISTLRTQVCNGAVEAVVAALAAPSGKEPSQRDVQLSDWYNEQPSSVQDRVREVIEEAVEQATFNFLAVLDGVAPVGSGEARLELSAADGHNRMMLNNPSGEELHRLFARSRGCSAKAAESSVSAYEVGKFSELKDRQKVTDLLHLHRVPTKFQASQTIQGYDADSAPCMALPPGEHRRVESA
jgi:hypothetical protein